MALGRDGRHSRRRDRRPRAAAGLRRSGPWRRRRLGPPRAGPGRGRPRTGDRRPARAGGQRPSGSVRRTGRRGEPPWRLGGAARAYPRRPSGVGAARPGAGIGSPVARGHGRRFRPVPAPAAGIAPADGSCCGPGRFRLHGKTRTTATSPSPGPGPGTACCPCSNWNSARGSTPPSPEPLTCCAPTRTRWTPGPIGRWPSAWSNQDQRRPSRSSMSACWPPIRRRSANACCVEWRSRPAVRRPISLRHMSRPWTRWSRNGVGKSGSTCPASCEPSRTGGVLGFASPD